MFEILESHQRVPGETLWNQVFYKHVQFKDFKFYTLKICKKENDYWFIGPRKTYILLDQEDNLKVKLCTSSTT